MGPWLDYENRDSLRDGCHARCSGMETLTVGTLCLLFWVRGQQSFHLYEGWLNLIREKYKEVLPF